MSAALPRRYVSSADLAQLRDRLSGRDLAIVAQVADLRLMSAGQILAVHFPLSEHDSSSAAERATQRVLARLTSLGVLARLERQVGGTRSGSSGFVYSLGPIGQRLLTPEGPRRREYEPGLRFLDHTLAITQLVVDITTAARRGALDVLMCQAEPHCHREFSGPAGRQVLSPDLFLAIGVDDLEYRWFVEVDRGSESLPVVMRKCQTYDAYYRSGKEQAAHGVFPKVCWLVPDRVRAERIRQRIAKDRRLTEQLFAVSVTSDALATFCGGAP